jgi:hypothetical protein
MLGRLTVAHRIRLNWVHDAQIDFRHGEMRNTCWGLWFLMVREQFRIRGLMTAHGRGEVIRQVKSSAASNGVQSVGGGDCGDGKGTRRSDYRSTLIIRTRTPIAYSKYMQFFWLSQ